MKTLCIITFIIIALLITGCGSGPAQAFNTFAEEICKPGVDMLSRDVLALYTDDHVSRLHTSEAGDEILEDTAAVLSYGFKVESIKESSGVATIKWHSNRADRTFTATMMKEDGFWRLEDWSTLDENIDWIMDK